MGAAGVAASRRRGSSPKGLGGGAGYACKIAPPIFLSARRKENGLCTVQKKRRFRRVAPRSACSSAAGGGKLADPLPFVRDGNDRPPPCGATGRKTGTVSASVPTRYALPWVVERAGLSTARGARAWAVPASAGRGVASPAADGAAGPNCLCVCSRASALLRRPPEACPFIAAPFRLQLPFSGKWTAPGPP